MKILISAANSLVLLILPLILNTGVAFAQTNSQTLGDPPVQPSPTPVAASPSPQVLNPDASSAPSLIIPLKDTEQIQLQLVNCQGSLDCFLSDRLLPPGTRLNQLELKFDNPTPKPLSLLNTAIDIHGTLTHYPLPSNVLSIRTQQPVFPPRQISNLMLDIKRAEMPPEQYIGAIYLTQTTPGNRIVLPIFMSVRCGPLWPILVLLMGILLGRLLKYMQEQGGPQAQSRKQLYQLEADIKDSHPSDRKILLPMVQDVRKLIYRQQLDVVATQVTLIRSRLEVLNQLRRMEDAFDQKRKAGTPIDSFEQLIEQIQEARSFIAQGQEAKAQQIVSQILDSTNIGTRSAGVDDGAAELEGALRGASVQLDNSLRNALSESKIVEITSWPDRLEHGLVMLSGLSDQVRAETTFWFVRPLLYFVLIVGLTIVGLNSLYIEKGESFGARPMDDYLGLLLWGLSADVAGRGLSTLKGTQT